LVAGSQKDQSQKGGDLLLQRTRRLEKDIFLPAKSGDPGKNERRRQEKGMSPTSEGKIVKGRQRKGHDDLRTKRTAVGSRGGVESGHLEMAKRRPNRAGSGEGNRGWKKRKG